MGANSVAGEMVSVLNSPWGRFVTVTYQWSALGGRGSGAPVNQDGQTPQRLCGNRTGQADDEDPHHMITRIQRDVGIAESQRDENQSGCD